MTDESGFAEKLINGAIVMVFIIGVAALGFAAKNLFGGEAVEYAEQNDHFGLGGFTEYDLQLAREIMDEDGDGICDVCGMDVDICIANGQLQCNMGDDGKLFKIGVLDKSKQKHHYHADFKVFINGEAIDFNNPEYFVKSRFVHVENDPQGDSGEVLHMHATGVPLWLFFESIGMELSDEHFKLDTGELFRNDGVNTIKFYVNGQPSPEYGDYVFKDGDRILVSYGPRDQDMGSELSAVTDNAKNH